MIQLTEAEARKLGLFVPKVPSKARAKGPNSWERWYAEQLAARKYGGDILDYRFEGLTLRLAERTTYTPDFLVLTLNERVELVEVKGFVRDDARCKFKMASAAFPWFTFRWVKLARTKRGGLFVASEELWKGGMRI